MLFVTECDLLRERRYIETSFHNFSAENFMMEESFTASGFKNIITGVCFHPELHAARRTEKHRCPPGRLLSDTNTKNMQVPSSFKGILCIYCSICLLPAYFAYNL